MLVTITSLTAASLTPGVYRLKWDNRPASQDSLWSVYRQEQAAIFLSKPTERIRGAVSNRALAGPFWGDSFRICLDESKGSGKGYDTAYIGTGSVYITDVDCRKMVKIPLVARNGGLYATAFAADVPAGRRNAAPARRLFDIAARVQPDGRGGVTGKAWIYIRGAWHGRIKTDRGYVPVRLMEKEGFGQWQTVIMGRADNSELDEPTSLSLLHIGGAITFDNELYSLRVSPKGDSLSIQPYGGPTGVVRVRAVDGYGRPVRKASMFVGNLRYSCSQGRKVMMPVGNYDEVTFNLQVGDRLNLFTIYPSLPRLTIRKGAQTIDVGGPLSLGLEVGKSSDGARSIAATLLLPQPQQCRDWPTGVKASLQVRNWRGQTVHSEAIANESGFSVFFDLPRTLRPGVYTALISIDARPYDKKRVFGVKLRVR